MKKIEMLFSLLFVLCGYMQAQTIEVVDDLFISKRLSQTAGTYGSVTVVTADSGTVAIPYNGYQYPTLLGQTPDSIKWVWWTKGTTSGDSVGIIFTYLATNNGGNFLTRNTLDSSKVQEVKAKLLTRTAYDGLDVLRWVVGPNAGVPKSQYITNGGVQLILRQKRYFHK